MRLGVNLPNFGPGTDPGMLRAWAGTVEDLGYDLLLTSDHLVVTNDVATQYPAPFYEPLTALSWLSGLTSRLTLGTTVLVAPYRHPLAVARMVANIADFNGGRFVLGVGSGWATQEFTALGVDVRRRGQLTDELIDTVRAAWRDVTDYRCEDVPIWVGGNSPVARRRAVARGDAWHPIHLSTAGFLNGIATLRNLVGEGKTPPEVTPRVLLRLSQEPDPSPGRLAGTGSLKQVRDDLVVLRNAGASVVVLDTIRPDPGDRSAGPEGAWDDLARVAALDLSLP